MQLYQKKGGAHTSHQVVLVELAHLHVANSLRAVLISAGLDVRPCGRQVQAVRRREQACSTSVSSWFFAVFCCRERQGGWGKTGLLLRPFSLPSMRHVL